MPDPDEEGKKWTRGDIFAEILQASAALDCEQKGWRVNIADNLVKEGVDRRYAQESQQEKDKALHQGIMAFLRQQTQML